MKAWIIALKVASLVVCVAVTFPQAMDLLSMEFGGGGLTGPLVYLALAGCGLFVAAMALTFVTPRTGTIVAGFAAIICLPLDAYRIAPSSLSWLTSAPASVRSSSTVHFSTPALQSLIAIAIMVAVHLLLWHPARLRA